ncbi:MAG: hypothetical protein U9O98_07480, partial [Asgard group archaeon]|nr:hypothetical protein [Asgard group archaeon]
MITLNFEVKIDSSFLDIALNYLLDPSSDKLKSITQHIVAKDIYENANLFQNIGKTIDHFWKELLMKEKEKGREYLKQIRTHSDYFQEHREEFFKAFNTLEEFIPLETNLSCKLYLMFGYDLGIANER